MKTSSKIFDLALLIFLTIIPIAFVPFNVGLVNGWFAKFQIYQFSFFNVADSKSISLIFMELGILLLFVVSMFSKQVRQFNDYYMSILFFLVVVSVLIHPIGIKLLPYVASVFIFYYISYTRVVSYKAILYPFVIVSSFNTLFAIFQVFGFHFLHNINIGYVGQRIDGLMSLSTYMACYQALAAPICYYINPWLVFIPLTGLMLSGAYMPLIATVIGLSYLMVMRFNLLGVPFLGLYSIVAMYLALNYQQIAYKIYIRSVVWLQSSDITIFGHSLKNFETSISTIGKAETSYSLILTVFYYLGIVGAITFILMICRIIFNYFANKRLHLRRCIFASFIILMICSFTQSIVDTPRLVIPCMSVLMLLNLSMVKQKGETECQL